MDERYVRRVPKQPETMIEANRLECATFTLFAVRLSLI